MTRKRVAIAGSWLSGVFAVVLTATVVWAQCWGQQAKKSGYANARLLIGTQEVAAHLEDASIRLVDLRAKGAEGYAEYKKAHIPGAVYLNWVEIDDVASNQKGFPMDQTKAEALFGKLGIDQNTRVVAYDDSGGLWATRLFFVLEFFGHKNVAVLDGGLTKWVKEGRPLSAEEPKITPKKFVARPNPKLIATAEWVKDNLKNPGICLVDARSPQEYQGKQTHPTKEQDPEIKRGGRIPGAVSINWSDTINPEDKTFKSAEELQKMFAKAGATKDREVVVYCRTGVRAAHDYFVARLLGYEKVRNYDGSWIDWGNRPDLPLER
ncbi:MAG: sulfurtransferase [candidate division NC10 bacterium]|nr:sulfurtransferase [candidate division NC10 bacterium]